MPNAQRKIERDEYLSQLLFKKERKFSNMYVHQKQCKHKFVGAQELANTTTASICNDEEKNNNNFTSCPGNLKNDESDDSIDDLDYNSQDRTELVNIIYQLKRENKLLRRLQNTTVNVTNNININLDDYGSENLSHIDWIKHFIAVDLPKLLKEIHFHPDVPENNNIRLKYDKMKIFWKKE